MDIIQQLYDFFAGPCLYITITLSAAGLLRKGAIILSGTGNGLRFPPVDQYWYLRESGDGGASLDRAVTMQSRSPVLAVVTALFHAGIIAAPLTAAAHGILINRSWGLFPPVINPQLTGILTVTAVAAGVFLILRRSFVPHVLAVSSWRDYAAMSCVLLPFVTGYMARSMPGSYEVMLLAHVISGNLLIAALGWTRLGHMVFFAAWRINAAFAGKGAAREFSRP